MTPSRRPPSEEAPGGRADMAVQLRALIVNGALPAGSRITERQISELFGCTAATARELFHQMEKAGTITQSARRGARVVDAATAPPEQMRPVWLGLRRFADDELARAGHDLPRWSPVSGASRAERLEQIERRVALLGELAGSPRLTQLMSRLAVHICIVAPDMLVELEESLRS